MAFGRKLLLILLVVLYGCSTESPSPATPASLTPQVESGPTATTIDVSGGNGAITGILIDTDTNQPIADLGVFLADLTPGPEGTNIIRFSATTSKHSITDATGQFVIDGIKPGAYSLAVWTPMDQFLVPQPGKTSEDAILLDVKAGEITNVGDLKIRRPR